VQNPFPCENTGSNPWDALCEQYSNRIHEFIEKLETTRFHRILQEAGKEIRTPDRSITNRLLWPTELCRRLRHKLAPKEIARKCILDSKSSFFSITLMRHDDTLDFLPALSATDVQRGHITANQSKSSIDVTHW
jgi:hypothetical protein